MERKIGIDLGTSNTRICVKGKGIIYDQATAVSFSADGDVINAGDEAKEMLGKTPADKEAVTPVKKGVIANFSDCSEMLSDILRKTKLRGLLSRPKIAVSVPCGITEVERNAYENVCIESGGRDVFMLIKQPVAAALGCGFDVMKSGGRLICDIGGGKTQTAVISYRGVINSGAVRVGGDDFDDAIIRYVKDQYNVLIGRGAAENVKIEIGCVHRAYENGEKEIFGRNLLTGQIVKIRLRSAEIREAAQTVSDAVTDNVKSVLEKIPAELSSDVFGEGLTLCGGGALLRGIDRMLAERLGMIVKTADDPLHCICLGTEKIMNSPGEMLEAVSAGEDEIL